MQKQINNFDQIEISNELRRKLNITHKICHNLFKILHFRGSLRLVKFLPKILLPPFKGTIQCPTGLPPV